MQRQINVILFEQVTTMDALGPAEVFSSLPDHYRLHFISQNGGLIPTSTGNQILTEKFNSNSSSHIMLIFGE